MASWPETFVRSFVFLGLLFFMTKFLGKKQLSELSFFEYVSGITIGSIAGEAIAGLEKNMFQGMMAITIFTFATLFADLLALKSKTFRDFIEGKGTVLIKDGKVLEENLKKEKYSIDELSALLRQKDIYRVADVEFAVLEPRGNLSALLKKENRPLTPKDLNMKVANEKEPQTIIMDGSILDVPLSASGKSRDWLRTELEKLGLTVENVFIGQVDSYGELTVDVYDDKLQIPSPNQRPLLLASLKKTQADFDIFALETIDEASKVVYQKNAKLVQETIEKLTPYLTS